MILEVLVYSLDSETNATLVALYEERETESLPQDLSQFATVLHRELHEWVERNEKWLIEEKRIGLVEN